MKDGDLIMLIGRILEMRGRDTVRVTEVKEHVDESMVREGRVRELDRLGNDAADEAADFPVIDARRNFAGVCGWWYPVDDGDGTELGLLVRSAGALPKRRRIGREESSLAEGPGSWCFEGVGSGAWTGEGVAGHGVGGGAIAPETSLTSSYHPHSCGDGTSPTEKKVSERVEEAKGRLEKARTKVM